MTQPRLFIIESLTLEDEKADRFEGGHLSKILTLSGSKPEYMYLRTRKELEEAIDLFEDSDFRYLHISCHGNRTGIDLTFDSLAFEELGKMLAPVLPGKRVFFSSCSVMTDRCAQALLPQTGCYSVVGPSSDINFDRATVFWSAFYHLMLRDEARSIQHAKLQNATSQLKTLFGVQMRYYRSSKATPGFKRIDLMSTITPS